MTASLSDINFLYLGGDKCGSTWLHAILDKHPDVALAHAKELFYFDRFYGKGPRWYAKQFPKAGNARRLGEICHDYLYADEALARIAKDLPEDAVFLITLRKPLERSVSHYRYLKKIGKVTASFEDAIVENPRIIQNSLYADRIRAAYRHLGRERVHVLWFDDLSSDPVAFGRSVCEALDVRFFPDLPYTERILEGTTARVPGMVHVLRNIGWLARAMGAPRIVAAIKGNPLITRALYANSSKRSETKDIVPAHLAASLRDTFAKDSAALRELLGPERVGGYLRRQDIMERSESFD